MADTMVSTGAQMMARLMKVSRDYVVKYAKDVAPETRMRCVTNGKATPLWSLGHLASTQALVFKIMGGGKEEIYPKDWGPKFRPPSMGGDPISRNAADYPAWDEVLDVYKRMVDRNIALMAGLSDEDLAGPPKIELPEPLRARFTTVENSVMIFTVHEGHHVGQMNLIAKVENAL